MSSCSDSQPENANYVKYPPTALVFCTSTLTVVDLYQPWANNYNKYERIGN